MTEIVSRNVQRTIAVVFTVCMIGLAAWILCNLLHNEHYSFWRSATKRIEAGAKEIMFSELTNFKWDKVCILEPYSLGTAASRERRVETLIQGQLGEFRPELPKLDDDGDWAFVFIERGQVVRIQEKGRGYYLYNGYKSNCISSDEARFTVNGEKIYIND